jgi:hypothetical protein
MVHIIVGGSYKLVGVLSMVLLLLLAFLPGMFLSPLSVNLISIFGIPLPPFRPLSLKAGLGLLVLLLVKLEKGDLPQDVSVRWTPEFESRQRFLEEQVGVGEWGHHVLRTMLNGRWLSPLYWRL